MKLLITEHKQPENTQTLFYFHGGGLMFGNRDDLPQPHIDWFLKQGFNLICVDYPLAPETPYQEILQATETMLKHYIQAEGIESFGYWGRSAGAFLAFSLSLTLQPKFILSFYGYSFQDPLWVREVNEYYLDYPKVSTATLERILTRTTKPTASQIEERYNVYVYARQHGTWLDMVHYDGKTLDLNRDIPTFFWHSLFDPDVPYRESKLLADKLKISELVTSFQKQHEIDDTLEPIAKELQQFLKNYC